MFSYSFGRRLALQPTLLVAGVFILSLVLVLPSLVSAQEQASDQTAVSEEVKAEVESDLTASPEVAKEVDTDIKAELDLPADFDPVVPNNFFNSVRYNFKKLGRNVQEGMYSAFASDQAHANLVKSHADMELVEATKLAGIDPENGKVVNILNRYKSHVEEAKDKVEQIKSDDPDFAKEFSAELAEDNLFVAPKVFNSMQDTMLNTNPSAVPQILKFKQELLAAGGNAMVSAASNETEMAEALKIMAQKNSRTPFSGILAADIFSQMKEQLPDVGSAFRGAFEEAINTSLTSVEDNIKGLEVSDEVKADNFQRFVEQLPGQSISRMKVIDQFKGRADLPPVMIARMQEVKARFAEHLSTRISEVVDDEVRKAMSEAMLEFKNPGVEDFKVMSEFRDMVPDDKLRVEITKKHDEGVQKFLGKFGDDANARQVTEEFRAITKKMENGEIAPDANFFKTMDELKKKLSPQQQQFVSEMETAGRDEMAQRMGKDPAFAQRFATFNPADTVVFDQIKKDFDPSQIPNFNQKFAEIEQSQADNFRTRLDGQNNPEQVMQLKQRFATEVPDAIKQKFEQKYQFNEGEFKKHEENAREREEFFKVKREQIEKEFKEKFGGEFPGQGSGNFPPQPGFGFPGQGFGVGGRPPAFQSSENTTCSAGTQKTEFGCELQFKPQEFNPEVFCTQKGGKWTGTFCEFPNQQSPTGTEGARQPGQPGPAPVSDMQAMCSAKGGTWTGSFCQFPSRESETSTQPKPPAFQPPPTTFDPAKACTEKGGTWTGSFCQFPTTQPPSNIQPPAFPPPTLIDPARACAEKGGTWTGSFCQFPTTQPPSIIQPPAFQPPPTTFDPAKACTEKGGTWTGSFCQFPTTQPPPQ